MPRARPHATTISRVLAGVPFKLLQDALIDWVKGVVRDRRLDVSVDGKWAKRLHEAETTWILLSCPNEIHNSLILIGAL